jgi:hypothetical protein
MAGKKGRTGINSGGQKHTNKRSATQKTIDRVKMVQLMRRGWTQTAIAQELGLHQTQISYDWKIVLREMREQQSEDVAEMVTLKLEEYGELKREAWAAYELSKQNAAKRVEEEYVDAEPDDMARTKRKHPAPTGNGRPTYKKQKKVVTTTEGRLPGAEYLKIVISCLEAERELRGLNPAKKLELTGHQKWDIFTGIPPGDVPDEVEAEIKKLEDNRDVQDAEIVNSQDDD